MGLQNLRMFNNPTNALFRRDVKTQVVKRASTGRFARNMVLDGYFQENYVPIPMYLQTADFVDSRMLSCSTTLYGEVVASTNTSGARVALNPRFNSSSGYWSASTPADSYIGFKSNSQQIVDKVSIISYLGYTPNTIRIEGSNDDSTWTPLLETIIDTSWDTAYTPKVFDIPSETQNLYSYYRLYIITGNDATVRIYNIRFFIRDIEPTELDIVCSEQHPLICTFANGYDEENMPVDYVATVSTPQTITISDLQAQWPLLDLNRIRSQPWALYAEYNPSDGTVSFKFDRKNYDMSLDWTTNYAIVPPYGTGQYASVVGNYGTKIIGNGFKWWGYGSATNTRYELCMSNSAYPDHSISLSSYADRIQWIDIRKEDSSPFYFSGYYFYLESGTNGRNTYEYLNTDDVWVGFKNQYDFSPKSNIFMFNSPKLVKAVRIRGLEYSYSDEVKFNIFTPELIEHKLRWQDGSFQKYDNVDDKWNNIYRVYLGVVSFDSNNYMYLNYYENNLVSSFDRLDLATQLL